MVRRAREIVRDGAIAMSDDRGVSHIHDLALAPSGEPGINNGHREGSLLRRLHPSSQQSLDFALEPFVLHRRGSTLAAGDPIAKLV